MILEKLRHFWKKTAPARPHRCSPQGWIDLEPGWPDPHRERSKFSSPWEAVDLVEKTLQNLAAIRQRVGRWSGMADGGEGLGQQVLGLFSICLQVLSFLDCDLARRKGTFGRLSHILVTRLPELPDLAQMYPYNEQIAYLAEDLQYSGDPDLVQQGLSLKAVLTAVANREIL